MRGRTVLRILLVLLLALAVTAAFWLGLVPQRYSPFADISLDDPPEWFVDFRIAALRRDPERCQAVLRAPHIIATPISDHVRPDGCGWQNAVRISGVGGAEYGTEQLTCEAAVALALWMEYQVQPLAAGMLNTRVTGIDDMGTFSCRKMIGNERWANMRSQHSFANAIDIGGFRLADGRHISVSKDYKGSGPEAEFLREAHKRACGYFRVAIGPYFNAAHWNHLHFDRGIMTRCK